GTTRLRAAADRKLAASRGGALSIAKYLERYAEPEVRLASLVPGRYRAVLIVPAHRERAESIDGMRRAAAAAGGRVLVVLVVNAAEDSSDSARAETRELAFELEQRFGAPLRLAEDPPLALYELPELSLLLVDRASAGHELPAKQGVGLARKIGADLALALWAAGRVELEWLFSTDADVELPPDYFTAAAEITSAPVRGRSGAVGQPPRSGAAANKTVGLLFPFRHGGGGDALVDASTELYELTLRYHVLGLKFAASPYAYHSIGSALAVSAEAYAAVRGFPRRLAGEDFYLLDKLAKIGLLQPVSSAPIAIRARLSDRVPFGTGPRVRELCRQAASGETVLVYHPATYRALRNVLEVFQLVSRKRDQVEFASALTLADPELGPLASRALSELGLDGELSRALRETKTEVVLHRRLLTWFDALRTLRFIHALRDSGAANLPVQEALEQAPFVPRGALTRDSAEALAALADAERESAGPRGVPACFP
ncbi:MAG TPA: hypothetical protein VGP93_10845, partial [Polyangiaceae bacterium]|nr:hypothetical protein [Polyangiaceae bacterium]